MTLNRQQFGQGSNDPGQTTLRKIAVPRNNTDRSLHLKDHHGMALGDVDDMVSQKRGEGWSEGQALVRYHAYLHGGLSGYEGVYGGPTGRPSHHHRAGRY